MDELHARYLEQARWTHPLRQYLFGQISVPDCYRILDVGCGTGALFHEFNSYFGCKIFGVDISKECVLMAMRNYPPVLLSLADAHVLPFDDDSFDICFCHFLLLWVKNPKIVLSEMQRVTRNSGIVMVLAEPDYGGRIDYPPELDILYSLQARSLSEQGANPEFGRHLAASFHASGFNQFNYGLLGGEWSYPDITNALKQEWDILENDLSFLSQNIKHADLGNYKNISQEAKAGGVSFNFVPTFYAWGLVVK